MSKPTERLHTRAEEGRDRGAVQGCAAEQVHCSRRGRRGERVRRDDFCFAMVLTFERNHVKLLMGKPRRSYGRRAKLIR